ncbi:MAG: YgiT-type zinc finger protein [Deltaproteobacteria bacterium]|nr:YgiT-type zinc finger protein [Deltaproteobacteria bacterium]
MKCIICKSEDIVKKKVEEEIKKGKDVIFVPVETLVCQNCGEKYYDRRTVRFLEEIEKKVKKEKVSLEAVGRVLKVVGIH